MESVCVIGTGYVGLVVGPCLAEMGAKVVCVDNDKNKIESLERGEVPIYEPGLAEIIKRNVQEERLSFSTDTAKSVRESSVVYIAVGTPPGEDGSTDLSYVLAVAEDIAKSMNEYKLIVIKSTVPVGSSDRVKEVIKKYSDHNFDIVSNPEFLKEGAAVDDFMKPDRIILGVAKNKAAQRMKRLYAPLVRTGAPIYVMDNKSAEMTKYAANAMLATRISFMNEIANLCEKVGGDITHIRIGIGSDVRIGKHFLFPGVGFGGSCFPKDVKSLYKTAQDFGMELEVLKAVGKVNEQQKKILIPKILDVFKNDIKGKKIAVWGLAFKARTDDMREAPSLVIIEELLKYGAEIFAFDPEAMDEARKEFGDRINYGKTIYEVLKDADALVIITDWNAFRNPDFDKMAEVMNQKVIFDGRNLYELDFMKETGFKYISIGREKIV